MIAMRNTNGSYKPLLATQRHGQITNGDLREILPDVSAETPCHDLVELVKRGLLRRHGRCRGTTYSVVWGHVDDSSHR